MSRSRRQTPIFGITLAESEAANKRHANRRLRRAVTTVLIVEPERLMPVLREVSNVWTFDKDGKAWWNRAEPKDMRK